MRLPIKIDKAGLKLTDENKHVLADVGMMTNEEQEQIVRAVNEYDSLKRKADSHEALLESLKEALEVMGSWGNDGSPEWVATAEEAIAQAEKGA